MSNRKTPFVNEEFYHVYNRGVDRRTIFEESSDSDRFLKDMVAFNTEDPIGSLYLSDRSKLFSGPTAKKDEAKPLVNIVAYCLNPNHFHLLLEQVSDGGVSEFMKRLSGGYAWYFNNKNERKGSLFEGKFKAILIQSNEYLLHASVYVNLNDRVHRFSGPTAKKPDNKADDVIARSSWDEYRSGWDTRACDGICKKDDITGQFRGFDEYRIFAKHSLQGIRERRGIFDTEYFLEDSAG